MLINYYLSGDKQSDTKFLSEKAEELYSKYGDYSAFLTLENETLRLEKWEFAREYDNKKQSFVKRCIHFVWIIKNNKMYKRHNSHFRLVNKPRMIKDELYKILRVIEASYSSISKEKDVVELKEKGVKYITEYLFNNFSVLKKMYNNYLCHFEPNFSKFTILTDLLRINEIVYKRFLNSKKSVKKEIIDNDYWWFFSNIIFHNTICKANFKDENIIRNFMKFHRENPSNTDDLLIVVKHILEAKKDSKNFEANVFKELKNSYYSDDRTKSTIAVDCLSQLAHLFIRVDNRNKTQSSRLKKERSFVDYNEVNELIKKNNIIELHDKLNPIIRKIQAEASYCKYDYSKFKDIDALSFNKTISGITFKVPVDTKELVEVGCNFSNCVAGYNYRIDSASSLIVYGTKENENKVCIELIPTYTNYNEKCSYRVNQFYAPHNKRVEDKSVYDAFNSILNSLHLPKLEYNEISNYDRLPF